jgi:hypothetical protein
MACLQEFEAGMAADIPGTAGNKDMNNPPFSTSSNILTVERKERYEDSPVFFFDQQISHPFRSVKTVSS